MKKGRRSCGGLLMHEDGYDAGYDEGHSAGCNEGEIRQLITQIGKKKSKGKPHSVIADEIEEEIDFVEEICNIAGNISPEFDEKKIYMEYISRHKEMDIQTGESYD